MVDIQQLKEMVAKKAEILQRLQSELSKAVVGQEVMISRLLIGLLTGGHVLLEGVPGLAKTTAVTALAKALSVKYQRIQFTPDLLPADLIGTMIYVPSSSSFTTRKGPIFSNLVLADEINRAPSKVQSALLEAMQERQVTIEGETLPLPEPFLVLATQNPIEYEGTFPLPEAQLDRFMLKLTVGYPSLEEEKLILRRRRERKHDEVVLREITKAEQLLQLRELVETVHVDADLEGYIAAVIHATRTDRRVAVGASPRGSLAFLKMARANAALEGRDFITPDDVKRYATSVLTHRIILQPEYWMARQVTEDVIRDVLEQTPVPVIK